MKRLILLLILVGTLMPAKAFLYSHPDLYLYFEMDPTTKEAVVGRHIDDDKITNAFVYPPIGSSEWDNLKNHWKNLVIPSTIEYGNETYTVVGIADHAFCRTTSILTATLPETLRYIEESAFYACVNLESINIQSPVTVPNDRSLVISDQSFEYCKALKSVHLPEGVTSIGYAAFADCISLREINIPGKCKKIGVDAFRWCRALSKIIIEDGEETLKLTYSYGLNPDIDAEYYHISPTYRCQFSDCMIDTLYLGRNLSYELPPFKCDGANRFFSAYGYYNLIPSKTLHVIGFGENVTCLPDSVLSRAVIMCPLPPKLETIGNYALSNCGGKVVIPNSVTKIGNSAFGSITEIILGENIKEIGSHAFNHGSYTDITIPTSVESIGENAFSSSLRFAYCLTTNPQVESNPFGNATVYVPSGSGSKYREKWDALIVDPNDEVISVNVKTAGSLYSRLLARDIQIDDVLRIKLKGSLNEEDISILNSMPYLYDIDFSEVSMEELPNGFFKGKNTISNVKLPNNLSSIRDEEFADCKKLSGRIAIPSSCTKIGQKGFFNTSIDGVDYMGDIMFEKESFAQCEKLKSLIVKSGTIIKSEAFSDNLEEVIIEDGVRKIEDNALGNYLKKITFEGTIDSLGYIKTNPELEVFASDVNTWCKVPFPYARHLYIGGELAKDIVIPEGINRIRDNAFLECESLESIKMANDIVSIGTRSFSGCERLQSVELSNSIVALGDYAFFACSNIKSLSLPKQLRTIGVCTFSGCSGISELSLPSKVRTIGEAAFNNCTALSNMKLSEALDSIGYDAFAGCINLTPIIIPNSVTFIDGSAFEGCVALEEIDIPMSVLCVGNGAFKDCSNLRKVIVHWNSPITIQNPFEGVSENCCLYVPIGTATKYRNAGWDMFANMKESGYLTVTSNIGGVIMVDNSMSENRKISFPFTPYKSFYVSIQPKEGYYVKKIKMNGVNVTDELEDGKLFFDEPEEDMTLSVVFADNSIADGDVNGDGVVNKTDVICVVNHILKQIPANFYDYIADTNDDEIINITDAIKIVKLISQ